MNFDHSQPPAPLPPDDLTRALTIATSADDSSLKHIGIVGDTYTILVSGKQTNGRYCLIDMHVPPGGGPPPHRHDFEEAFTVVEGEIELVFRGKLMVLRAGGTVNIPANAPHQFQNMSRQAARLFCICAPAGQDVFFQEVGVIVTGRTTPPPKLNDAAQAAMKAKSEALAGKYVTEFVKA